TGRSCSSRSSRSARADRSRWSRAPATTPARRTTLRTPAPAARTRGRPSTPAAGPTAPATTADSRSTVTRARRTTSRSSTRAPTPMPGPAPLRFGGYVQADWQMFRQSSENEIDPSTGAPLNENRFVLRRGHLRADAEHHYVLASLEIDANTVNGPQVRPIDAEASVRWPANVNSVRERELGGFHDPKASPYVMGTLGL